jgi:hypothetical protein
MTRHLAEGIVLGAVGIDRSVDRPVWIDMAAWGVEIDGVGG